MAEDSDSSSNESFDEILPDPTLLEDGRLDILSDGKLIKKIIKNGDDGSSPRKDSQVTVHYTGTLVDGTKFDSSYDRGEPFSFKLGIGHVIKGWDIAVRTMKQGEVAQFTIASELAYGEKGDPPRIPPNTTIIFTIELITFTHEPETEEERIEFANARKLEGNELVKQGKYFEARDVYERGLDYVEYLFKVKQELQTQLHDVRIALLLNKSLCCLKTDDNKEAITMCEEILRYDPQNVKALFRRGQAWKALGDLVNAKSDLYKASQLQPNDKGIREELQKLLEQEKKITEKQKVQFSNMFQKIKDIEQQELKEKKEKEKVMEEDKKEKEKTGE